MRPQVEVFAAAIFAINLNVLVGYGGLVSFGQASFFGLASYVAAISITSLGISSK